MPFSRMSLISLRVHFAGYMDISPFMPSGRFYNSLDRSISSSFLILLCFIEFRVFNAHSADPDQTPRFAAFYLGLHCLPMSMNGLIIQNYIYQLSYFIPIGCTSALEMKFLGKRPNGRNIGSSVLSDINL